MYLTFNFRSLNCNNFLFFLRKVPFPFNPFLTDLFSVKFTYLKVSTFINVTMWEHFTFDPRMF
jgi:hypothetical protein